MKGREKTDENQKKILEKENTHTRRETEYTNKSNIIIKLLKNRKTRKNGLKIQSLTHTCYYTLLLQKTKTLRKQSTRKRKGEKHISVASKKSA